MLNIFFNKRLMATNNEDIDTICNICYEELGDKNTTTTPCGHKFCFQCIIEALQYNNNCPCCRETLQIPKHNHIIESDIESDPYDDIHMGHIDETGLYHLPINISSNNDFYQTLKEFGHLYEIHNPNLPPAYYFHHTLLKLIYGNTIDLDKELYYEHEEFNAYVSLAICTTESIRDIAFIFRRTHLLKKMLMIRFMNFPHIYGFSVFQNEQNLPIITY